MQVVLAHAVLVQVIIGRARQDSEELVETVCIRSPLGTKAEMPFSNQGCLVPAFLEERSNSWNLWI
jgi:hypothetical protein